MNFGQSRLNAVRESKLGESFNVWTTSLLSMLLAVLCMSNEVMIPQVRHPLSLPALSPFSASSITMHSSSVSPIGFAALW